MDHYIILGCGKSGQATASWCQRKGFSACIVDDSKESAQAWAEKEKIAFPVMNSEEFCRYAESSPHCFSQKTFCITSPGIPYTNKAFKKMGELHIQTVSEVELALRQIINLPPLIGVTGTNGKTTVVELITHIINASGKKAKAVGNIGTPLIEAFTSREEFPDWFIVELSSFQLALTFSKRFSIGCWLNIAPNHLDWHASMEEYIKAKEKLYSLTLQDGFFFIHESISQFVTAGSGPRLVHYGSGEKNDLKVCGEFVSFDEERFPLPGLPAHAPKHDRDNYLVAYGVARMLGISPNCILRAFETFKKPSHRIEFVRSIGEVAYIDDSKSSNVASTEAALYSCEGPVVLIAGGVHKGAPYTSWGNFSEKVQAIIAIGEAKEHISRDVGDKIPVLFAPSLFDAVKMASTMNSSGTVLLSPGCSSFDMFRDYKDRGRQFKEIVRSLASAE